MLNGQRRVSNQDVPLVVALFALGLVVRAYFWFRAPTAFSTQLQGLDSFIQDHSVLVTVVFTSFSVNIIWIYSVLSRAFGLRMLGSRLEVLTGERKTLSLKDIKRLGVCSMIGAFSFAVLTAASLPNLEPSSLTLSFFREFSHFGLLLRLCLSFSFFVVAEAFGRASGTVKLSGLGRRHVPERPKPKDGIALGTFNEDLETDSPEWKIMNRRALNGNVLVTGSIGTGKTQGFILSAFDQILGNFETRPSILAIDPKGTFVPEALKIIERHGLSEHVLHLKLGGSVTFNPIHCPDGILKNARFLDSAQMIRAAATNFMGKSFDSPFWEISAFNLIKNSIVLCGAKFRDVEFGLIELYNEMISISKDGQAAANLSRQYVTDGEFDDEESFNVECAAKYFEEFSLMDDKVKTGILATSTAFLNQFQEFQAGKIFCPKTGEATIKSMDEVVDSGKILLFDIESPALARSMGTFIKLHFQQSILNRLSNPNRSRERTAFIIVDEYQDVASSGGGAAIGDDRFTSKSREANACFMAGTQSHSSLRNSIGKDDAVKELLQNFRTMIACQSTDMTTIKNFQELIGQEDRKKQSHSYSENSRQPNRNLMLGGFDAADANISESISTSEQKEYSVTGREFSRLTTFESFALIYDGIRTEFKKLFFKPYYLEKKNVLHKDILSRMASALSVIAFGSILSAPAQAFPNVCSVVKSSEFRSCLDFKVSTCMCGWPIPRPCAHFEYYVPQTFIETHPDGKDSFFDDLPGAKKQLTALKDEIFPFGAEGDEDTQSFHSHSLAVPYTSLAFSMLPCGGTRRDSSCFDAMSEHLGQGWNTGSPDTLQPNFLAWSLNPKACLIKGAISSAGGGSEGTGGSGFGCSYPIKSVPKYPPSSHSACTGWGIFYPRSGVYNGPGQTTGALMVSSRMKSLGGEVFRTTPASMDEQWQMIIPQTSSCFREGQNVGILDTVKNVREIGRLSTGKLKGHLFTVWSKVSCCKDLGAVPGAYAGIEAMGPVCEGLGAL